MKRQEKELVISKRNSAIITGTMTWDSNSIPDSVRRSVFYFLLAGLFEIGGGYLIWLWLREDMSWILGVFGGIVLFFYGIIPTFQPSHFHRIYAAYGGIFIVMAMLWGWIFEGLAPDNFDILGGSIALFGVAIIYYAPRNEDVKRLD